jgi:hypothetical protein
MVPPPQILVLNQVVCPDVLFICEPGTGVGTLDRSPKKSFLEAFSVKLFRSCSGNGEDQVLRQMSLILIRIVVSLFLAVGAVIGLEGSPWLTHPRTANTRTCRTWLFRFTRVSTQASSLVVTHNDRSPPLAHRQVACWKWVDSGTSTD